MFDRLDIKVAIEIPMYYCIPSRCFFQYSIISDGATTYLSSATNMAGFFIMIFNLEPFNMNLHENPIT